MAVEQLIMRWKNDGRPATPTAAPPGCSFTSFPDLPGALGRWLDIVSCGLTNDRRDAAFYDTVMKGRRWYEERLCFFLLCGEQAVATASVLCDRVQNEGYIHMVACCDAYRGRGYGTALNALAVETLKREGMQTAYLTTDDFRIPAIKGYLRAGFTPDRSTADFARRWDAVAAILKERA